MTANNRDGAWAQRHGLQVRVCIPGTLSTYMTTNNLCELPGPPSPHPHHSSIALELREGLGHSSVGRLLV